VNTSQQSNDGSVVDRLKDAFGEFLGAQLDRATSKASDKLSGLAGRLTESAEHDGALPKMGARLLKGESPVKGEDVKDAVLGKLPGGGGGGGGGGGSKKVTFISEALDVGVPLRTAYDHWTEYENFGDFTKGVQDVSKEDETTSDWTVKIAMSTRSWKGNVVEQIPDDRIVWRTEGGQGTTHGAVSFHELAPTLTRILLLVEYEPSGFMEKTGNIWRAQGRRMRLDFKHFQRYVTFAEEEPEGWRGEIRDGEVVLSHEDALEQEGTEEPEDAEEAEEDVEEPEDAEEGEEEPEAEPAGARGRRR
jgi:hypothetical protein